MTDALPKTVLVTGGASCGKSAYAEQLALHAAGLRYYLATMRPFGEEGQRRLLRHRRMRAGKGFITIESYSDLTEVVLAGDVKCGGDAEHAARGELATDARPAPAAPAATDAQPVSAAPAAVDGSSHSVVLLECVGNLVANVLFSEDGSLLDPRDAFSRLHAGIENVRRQCDRFIVVTNEVGSGDVARFEGGTAVYRELVGTLNCALAHEFDAVAEVVAGIPRTVKGRLP